MRCGAARARRSLGQSDCHIDGRSYNQGFNDVKVVAFDSFACLKERNEPNSFTIAVSIPSHEDTYTDACIHVR